MIRTYTRLRVADNTGAKELLCVRVLGTGNQKYGRVGDVIVGTVKEATPGGSVTKGSVVHAVIVRTKKETVFEVAEPSEGVFFDMGFG